LQIERARTVSGYRRNAALVEQAAAAASALEEQSGARVRRVAGFDLD
jgi:hypothetical protein